jgi:hypothetical protein
MNYKKAVLAKSSLHLFSLCGTQNSENFDFRGENFARDFRDTFTFTNFRETRSTFRI